MTIFPAPNNTEPQQHAPSTGCTESRIAGIGCDVVGLVAFQRQVDSRFGSRFLGNLLTSGEIDRCGATLAEQAAHWAVKEAISKVIGCGWTGFRPLQIDLTAPRPDQHPGRWIVERSDSQPWPQNAHQWSWHVSISQSAQHTTALAIATREAPRETCIDAGTTASPGLADDQSCAQPLPSGRDAHRQRDPITEGTGL